MTYATQINHTMKYKKSVQHTSEKDWNWISIFLNQTTTSNKNKRKMKFFKEIEFTLTSPKCYQKKGGLFYVQQQYQQR